eukprot:SAG31_NODE_10202_length_1171_cov_2.652985_2_plen_60_part_00
MAVYAVQLLGNTDLRSPHYSCVQSGISMGYFGWYFSRVATGTRVLCRTRVLDDTPVSSY